MSRIRIHTVPFYFSPQNHKHKNDCNCEKNNRQPGHNSDLKTVLSQFAAAQSFCAAIGSLAQSDFFYPVKSDTPRIKFPITVGAFDLPTEMQNFLIEAR